MGNITRRLVQSVIALKKAVNKGTQMNNSLNLADRFLPPAYELELNNANNSLNTDYNDVGIAKGNYDNNS